MFNRMSSIKGHRTSALINGTVIGVGIAYLLAGVVFGILPLIVGIAAEMWKRSQLPSDS